MEPITIEDIGYVAEIRMRLGLDSNNTSRDNDILAMTPFQRVQKIVGWHLGSDAWADAFREYCESQGLFLGEEQHEPEVEKKESVVRYVARENAFGEPGWHVCDIETDVLVARVYGLPQGKVNPDEVERQARACANALNGLGPAEPSTHGRKT